MERRRDGTTERRAHSRAPQVTRDRESPEADGTGSLTFERASARRFSPS
ncbi:hypothetical protein [Haloferax mucosum]|nr:hypothetical protein [Haloferax mucosum]